MRGFLFLIVFGLILAMLPLIEIETRLIRIAETVEARLIDNQKLANMKLDIIRTLTEVARECKEEGDPRICGLYLNEWQTYWVSRGVEIEWGKIYMGKVVIKAEPELSRFGVLRPRGNVTGFGAVIRIGNYTFSITGGDWS